MPWWGWVLFGVGATVCFRRTVRWGLKDWQDAEGDETLLALLLAMSAAMCLATGPVLFVGDLLRALSRGRRPDYEAWVRIIGGESRADRGHRRAQRIADLERRNAELERELGIR